MPISYNTLPLSTTVQDFTDLPKGGGDHGIGKCTEHEPKQGSGAEPEWGPRAEPLVEGQGGKVAKS